MVIPAVCGWWLRAGLEGESVSPRWPTVSKSPLPKDSYGGSLVVSSHDRYFLDRTVTSLLVFENGSPPDPSPAPTATSKPAEPESTADGPGLQLFRSCWQATNYF